MLILCLRYATNYTRVDIAFAIGISHTFNNTHNDVHWNTVNNMMKYLNTTIKWFEVSVISFAQERFGAVD